ncbi:MAG: hypothetical protein ACI9U2_002615 [Bradymonadia bacterium]|jgi:hypothetical protein
MSAQLTMTTREHQTHCALQHLMPMLDPPTGALPDAEDLVALAEGRLADRDANRVRALIADSPAARVELRALYPQTHARLFDTESITVGSSRTGASKARSSEAGSNRYGAQIIAFRRRVTWGVGIALAAAVAFFILRPLGPPAGSAADLTRTQGQVRSGGDQMLVMPGEAVDLTLKLGQASTLDRWRGGAPWAALIRVDADGARVVCTHADAFCRSAPNTMGSQQVISGAAGDRVQFTFLVANQPADLSGIAGPRDGAAGRIAAAAQAAGGALRPVTLIVIDRP